VLDVLERFARDIPGCEQTADQVRCTLKAVREALQTDAVYWYPGLSGGTGEVLADRALPPDWCRDFTQKLLRETPGVDGQLLRSSFPSAGPGQPAPRSAALARVSKSQSVWIVALRFDPAREFQVQDVKALSVIRQMLLNQCRRARLCSRMSDTLLWLVQCLTASIDSKVPFARGHSERVAQIAVQLGKQLRLPASVVSDIYFAGLLHDIGLTGVREAVLLKPGKLTDEEFVQVKQYPVLGDQMLAGISQLAHLRPAVRNHHERFDGRGYPDGLAGEAIPLMARILAVADGFDAMLSPRPYRDARPAGQVEAILAEGAGKQWDPVIVDRFMACRPDLYQIFRSDAGHVPPAVRSAVEVWGADSSHHNLAGGPHPRPLSLNGSSPGGR
jgi:HD-GYP domain-containing protein (c-di-GMP phosphodiesterase class II)